MDDLKIRKDRAAGRITLTRPQALNALSHEMANAVRAALDAWRDDDAVKLVILDAEGDKAFCAGGDIAAIYHAAKAGDHTVGQRFFADEYQMNAAGRLVPGAHPAPLRRWDRPVTLTVEFGGSVPEATRIRDRATIGDYAARLARISGHPVSMAGAGGNFVVLVLSEDERRAIGPRVAELIPGIPRADLAAIERLSPQNYCTVFAYSPGAGAAYSNAVAVIRAELPQRLRTSCVHEELAQGMGLANDSPDARPSIFNDDEEFAFLTRHDELLLKMLYDPRLRPGMTEAEARPIVQTIAAEMLP